MSVESESSSGVVKDPRQIRRDVAEFMKLYKCRISFTTPKFLRALIDRRIEQSGGEFESRGHYLSMIVQKDLAEAGVMTGEELLHTPEKGCLECFYYVKEFVPETHCPKCGKPLKLSNYTSVERFCIMSLLDRDLPKDQRTKWEKILKKSLKKRGVL